MVGDESMNKQLQAYYTKEQVITDYMVNSLNLSDGDKVLEPSVGDGAFIEPLIKSGKRLSIEAVDINNVEISKLTERYKDLEIIFRTTDTLFDESFDLIYDIGQGFDKIIGNPPYGAWQDMERRALLKEKYGKNTNVKETYTLFFERCLSLLNDGGKLSFIIPDTFLYIHSHKRLRKKILDSCEVDSILLFPSKLFPGVKFGYSKLCIITLTKVIIKSKKHEIEIYDSINSLNDIIEIDKGNKEGIFYEQQKFFKNDSYSFILDDNNEYKNLIERSDSKLLSDIADVATGIYTGNNTEFIFKRSSDVPRSKNYRVIKDVRSISKTIPELSGIAGEKHFIPIVKGSSTEPYKMMPNDWFIDWGTDAIYHYNNDKKARFQNSQYYFKKGLALPMVKSKKIKATLMAERVFDQSVVGIFPKDEENLYYLLALFNSDVGTKLIHLINPSVNNSANYLKKIPILFGNTKDVSRISDLAERLVVCDRGNLFSSEDHKQINDYFNILYDNSNLLYSESN